MDKRISLAILLLRPVLITAICLVHMPYIAGYSASIVDPSHFSTLLGPFIKDTFARTAVPLLTVISGYLACLSHNRYSYRRYVWHKTQRLLLPFVLWNLLLAGALYLSYTHLQYPEMAGELLQHQGWAWAVHVFGLQSFPVNGPLYFLRDLFFISLLAPLFAVLVMRRALAGLILLGLMALFVYQPQIKALSYAWLFRSDILFFFFLGFWAGHTGLDARITPPGKAASLWMALGLVALCVAITWLLAAYKPPVILHARLKPFLGIAFLLALPAIIGTVERYQHTRPVAWLKAISPYSFTLFLVHFPVAVPFSYLIDTFGLAPNNASPLLLQMAMMLVFLVLSAATAFVLARLYWKMRDNLRILPGRNNHP